MSFFTPAPPNPTPAEPFTFRPRAMNLFAWITGTMLSEMETLNTNVTNAAAALTLNSIIDTSASSVLIGVGSKSFTVSPSKSFYPGMWLSIADSAAPSTNSVVAQVTSYTGTSLVVNVPANGVFGSGTKAAWVISLTAAPSGQVSAAFAPVANAATLSAARLAMGVPDSIVINRIRNGNGLINQRGGVSYALAAGVYGHDGYKAGAAGCTYTFNTTLNKTTFTISAGSLINTAEGQDLQSGTHVASWLGTSQVKIGAGSFSASGTTGVVTGGTAIALEIGVGTFSQLLFEPGTVPSTFPFPDYGNELRRCQEYVYDKTITQRWIPPVASAAFDCQFDFPVEMRRIPAAPILMTAGIVANLVSSSSFDITKKGFRQSLTNNAASVDTHVIGRVIRFSCEVA